jgi:hypothetical protein
MEGLPVYLVDASFAFPKRELVQINIRLQNEPEETALLNDIPLDKFREILVSKFHFEPDFVDGKIGDMKRGSPGLKSEAWGTRTLLLN